MSLLSCSNLKNDIPDIYNLKNLETTYDDILIQIKIVNNKVFSVKIDNINLTINEDERYIDLSDLLSKNGIFDIQKYTKYVSRELKVKFFTAKTQSEVVKYFIINEDTRMRTYIINNTVLDNIYLDELTIYLATNDFSKFGEEYLNIKLNIKANFSINGNMCIECGQEYSLRNNKIIFYKDKDKDNSKKLDYVLQFIPMFFRCFTIGPDDPNKNISSFLGDNIEMQDSEILLKKIILPLHFYNKNMIDKGELICELYNFNNMLYVYFSKLILPNNEQFNFHKECIKCKQYLNKNTTKFNIYNSTCLHVLKSLISILRKNLGNNISIEIIISDLINEMPEYYKNNYYIKTYGKSVCYFNFEI